MCHQSGVFAWLWGHHPGHRMGMGGWPCLVAQPCVLGGWGAFPCAPVSSALLSSLLVLQAAHRVRGSIGGLRLACPWCWWRWVVAPVR